jgi:hypothetical protein
MNFKVPKNNEKYSWTLHSIKKMMHYGLTPQRVVRVINNPERKEEGIVPGTVAVMQTIGAKKKTEIWVMYIERSKINKIKVKNFDDSFKEVEDMVNIGLGKDKTHKKIITAWRYPGVSPIRGEVPVPEDVLEELNKMSFEE